MVLVVLLLLLLLLFEIMLGPSSWGCFVRSKAHKTQSCCCYPLIIFTLQSSLTLKVKTPKTKNNPPRFGSSSPTIKLKPNPQNQKKEKQKKRKQKIQTMEPFPSSVIAQKTWELENNIITVDPPSSSSSTTTTTTTPAPTTTATTTTSPDPASDAIFYYDESAQTKFQQEKPWANDPHYFKRVKISALALLKMVVHARSGGTIEVMGLMQGKTDGDAIIVMDAFALPVEGTETRVNAQADAYEYMVDYSQTNKQVRFLSFFKP